MVHEMKLAILCHGLVNGTVAGEMQIAAQCSWRVESFQVAITIQETLFVVISISVNKWNDLEQLIPTDVKYFNVNSKGRWRMIPMLQHRYHLIKITILSSLCNLEE